MTTKYGDIKPEPKQVKTAQTKDDRVKEAREDTIRKPKKP